MPNILIYWKGNTQKFPILIIIAWDFLAIPSSSIRVKHLFNNTYNICYYQQSCLLSKIIHTLILLIYTDCFTIYQKFKALYKKTETNFQEVIKNKIKNQKPNKINNNNNINLSNQDSDSLSDKTNKELPVSSIVI